MANLWALPMGETLGLLAKVWGCLLAKVWGCSSRFQLSLEYRFPECGRKGFHCHRKYHPLSLVPQQIEQVQALSTTLVRLVEEPNDDDPIWTLDCCPPIISPVLLPSQLELYKFAIYIILTQTPSTTSAHSTRATNNSVVVCQRWQKFQ
jgi:hypothetical protein